MRSVGKWPLDESGKHPVNEDDEEILARLTHLAMARVPIHCVALKRLSSSLLSMNCDDPHLGSKTQMPGTKPGHHVVFVIVSKKPYAWLSIFLPSAACAAARRAIGTR